MTEQDASTNGQHSDHADDGTSADEHLREVTVEHASATSVTGDTIRVTQSAVRSIDAATVIMTQSSAAHIQAEEIALHGSSAASIGSTRSDIYDSAVGLLHGPMTVREGTARVLLHIGPADCSVRPVLTARSALAAGAGLGLGLALSGRLLRHFVSD